MYWPLGTPRIFSAKVTNSVTTYDSDDNHEDQSLVAVSPIYDTGNATSSSSSKKAVQSDDLLMAGGSAQEVQDVEEREAQEDEAASRVYRSKMEFLDPHHALSASLEDGNKSGSSLDVTFSEELNEQTANGAILALKMSRNGALFATITVTEMTIWQTKVREHFTNFLSAHWSRS